MYEITFECDQNHIKSLMLIYSFFAEWAAMAKREGHNLEIE